MLNAARQYLLCLMALVFLALAAPAMAENCLWQKDNCFGIDWNTATTIQIANVDVKARDETGSTPLHWAAWHSKIDVINALIKKGANVNTRTGYGTTPLHWAARGNKNPEAINALVKNGADVNAKGKDSGTPLHLTAWNTNPEIVNALIQKGANINAKDKDGNTPLHLTAWNNKNPEVVNALIQSGADVLIKNNDSKTALKLGEENKNFYKSDAYWALNDAVYKQKE